MKNCGKTLILDLDQTCINTWIDPPFLDQIKKDQRLSNFFGINQSQGLAFEFILDRKLYFGMKRPYLKEFLAFAHRYFDNIVVWSAGQKEYVNEICKAIFLRDGFPLPRLIWARHNCDYSPEGFYYKPLRKMIFDLAERGNFCMTLEKSLIVDDRTYTFINNVENGVLIPEWPNWDPNDTDLRKLVDRTADTAFLQLINWLNRPEVLMADNYQYLSKTNIFR